MTMAGTYGIKEKDPQKRAERDANIKRLAFEKGLPREEIAKQFGLTDSRVSQILGVTELQAEIVRYLREHTDGPTAFEIARDLKMDVNRVMFMLDSMKKRGILTAEVGNGDNGHKQFLDVKLRKTWLAPTIIRERKAAAAAEVAQEAAPEPVAAEVAEVPAPVPVEVHDTLGAPHPPVHPEEPDEEPIAVQEIPRYPILWRLLNRDSDIQSAAKLLEKQGLEDLALQALAKTDDFTELEREYMKFARTHRFHEDIPLKEG